MPWTEHSPTNADTAWTIDTTGSTSPTTRARALSPFASPTLPRPVLDAALAAQDPGHLKARSIVQLATATTYVQQREIDQACAVASQALDLPADQRIGPITQRAQDLLGELEPWRGRPTVEELRERVVAL
jgi:hypothetical protein